MVCWTAIAICGHSVLSHRRGLSHSLHRCTACSEARLVAGLQPLNELVDGFERISSYAQLARLGPVNIQILLGADGRPVDTCSSVNSVAGASARSC